MVENIGWLVSLLTAYWNNSKRGATSLLFLHKGNNQKRQTTAKLQLFALQVVSDEVRSKDQHSLERANNLLELVDRGYFNRGANLELLVIMRLLPDQ